MNDTAGDPGGLKPAANAAAAFHAMPPDEALAHVAAIPPGLDSAEAARRLARTGPNELPAARGRHPALRFFAQFNNALIYFLLAGAVAAWILGIPGLALSYYTAATYVPRIRDGLRAGRAS